MDRTLDRMFNPRSVAVIGASEVPGKAAERRTRSLLEGGYRGEVFLINPKRDTLFGRKAFPRLTDVEKEVDLVMVVVAPRFVPSAVTDSVRMGAKGIIVITAGLGESGAEGKRIEGEILSAAARTGARLIGPNCSGMFSGPAQMNLLGIPGLRQGAIAVLAQSGNVIDSLTHFAAMRGVGFSRIISLGNAIGASFPEYIEYLKDDPETGAIIMYMEGIKQGNELVRVARETVKHKPVIALKVGRSGAGARAAASHTGSLAGDDAIVDAAFRQAGIVRVANVDELFDMAQVLSTCPRPKGNRVVILSEGGGDNSIAADNAEVHGMQVPVLSEITQQRIRPFLLEGMPASNPVDYGGTAEENPHVITECVKACMESDEVDGVYLTGFFGGFKDIIAPHVGELEEQTARELAELVKTLRKPLFVHTSFARGAIKSLDILKAADVPVFESSERASQCLAALMRFAENRRYLKRARLIPTSGERRPAVEAALARAGAEGRQNLLETESRELLGIYGIPLPEAALVRDREEAVKALVRFQAPLAIKVISPDIIHKSDLGGVKLNLRDAQAVEEAFETIMASACRATARERVLGALVSPMAAPGQECIVGMVRDPQFGPVVMFGLGGIFVEILRDVSFRVAPLAFEDVDAMIREIRGYRLLTGFRGAGPKDLEALRGILTGVAQMAAENPEIREIDLNPVIVHDKGASIVDSRVILG